MYLLSRKIVDVLKHSAKKAHSTKVPWFRRAKLQLNSSKLIECISVHNRKSSICETPLILENQRVIASKLNIFFMDEVLEDITDDRLKSR